MSINFNISKFSAIHLSRYMRRFKWLQLCKCIEFNKLTVKVACALNVTFSDGDIKALQAGKYRL
jgi:hypothetical protein